MTQAVSITIRTRIGDLTGPVVTLHGREAWALRMLTTAGERGCTPIEYPGPRWSEYVRKLRKRGFLIETVREPHGGDFPGHHGRYVLRSQVKILDPACSVSPSPANPSVIVRGTMETTKDDDDSEKRASGHP